MSAKTPASAAEIIESLMQRTALAVFLLALSYAGSALSAMAGEPMAIYLRYANWALSAAIVLILFPIFWQFIALRRRNPTDCAEPESYVVAMFQKAALLTFSCNFVLLIVLDFLIRKQLFPLSTSLMTNLLLSFNLSVLSLSFFLLTRTEKNDDENEMDNNA